MIMRLFIIVLLGLTYINPPVCSQTARVNLNHNLYLVDNSGDFNLYVVGSTIDFNPDYFIYQINSKRKTSWHESDVILKAINEPRIDQNENQKVSDGSLPPILLDYGYNDEMLINSYSDQGVNYYVFSNSLVDSLKGPITFAFTEN